ncbi:hypothetical protein L7F22_007832 [Adiantum nelumboides]|nr:hypothetical protein [Adiantum nelumboides]
MSVLALTYALELERHGTWRVREEVGGKTGQQKAEEEKLRKKKEEAEQAEDGGNGGAHETPQVARVEDESSEDEFQDVEEAGDEEAARVEEESTSSAAMQLAELELSKAEAEQDDSGAADAADEGAAPVEQSDEQAVVAATPDAEREDDEDDEEEGGEWITPDNVVKHKNRSLGLVTDEDMPLSLSSSSKNARNAYTRPGRVSIAEGDDGWSTVTAKTGHQEDRSRSNQQQQQQQQQAGKKKGKKGSGRLTVACMTGDYAVQNVLLQMGLSLVGIEGQRIKQVKSWVLRCHACAKICKDSERKFCPHCGNPTLLRTSVTSTSPDATGKAGAGPSQGGLQVHLKKNFQYRNRGTIYSLPLPKPGKGGRQAGFGARSARGPSRVATCRAKGQGAAAKGGKEAQQGS